MTLNKNYQILIALLILLFGTFACSHSKKAPSAIAEKGFVDLSSWDFDKDGIIKIKGEWEFYRNRLLTKEDFHGTAIPEISGYLSRGMLIHADQDNHESMLGDNGFATFRLRVKIKPYKKPLSLTIRYRLAGAPNNFKVGHDLKIDGRHIPIKNFSDLYIPLAPDDEMVEIVLQVLRTDFKDNKITFSTQIGPQKAFMARWDRTRVFKAFLVGIIFFMGAYHLVIYFFRKKDPSTLYFSIYCLLCCLMFDDWPIHFCFPGISGKAATQLGKVSYFFSFSFMFFFIRSLFPDEMPKRLPNVYLAIAFLLSIFQFGKNSIRMAGNTIADMTAISAIILLLWVIGRAVGNKRESSLLIFSGGLILALLGGNDILRNMQIINTGTYFYLGILGFLSLQACALALRFSNAFTTAENLTTELSEKNTALSRMDKVKDEFLTNTSHELRTPLNGIIGITESLIAGGEETLSEKNLASLSMIFSSSKRLAGLVNDILDFSRLKNRDIQLTKKPVDIKSLVKGVLSITKNLSGKKKLVLSETIPETIPFVLADENRLQQILYNLIGNAIKFTERGEINISAEQKNKMVEIRISDTGIGIPEDQLERIFKAFEQIDASPSRQFEGTGLGLSITQHLVKLHGGSMRVESTPERGSTFYFTLPVSTGRLEKNNRPKMSKRSRDFSISQMHPAEFYRPLPLPPQQEADTPYQVLVVDDDPVNLQVVANHLSLEDISFHTACDGEDVLNRIDSGELPQIILLDIMMPKITGYDVCRKLRETFSAAELPIIMLTAKNHVADLVEGYQAGANDYLSKPFSREELIARVNCHLGLKKAYETFMANQRLEREVEQQKQAKERARLREEKEKLEKLRYQLNPHFLFNALASIRGAVLSDRETAHKMISHLSEFTRLALSRGSMEILTVKQELEIIEHFLTMEQMRFGDYLHISIDMPPDAENIYIPGFIIQPLAENAVKYGSRTSPDFLCVSITVKKSPPDMLTLKISNTGTWVPPGTTTKKESTGTGIENVRQRLEKYYAGEYAYEQRVLNGSVIFEINMPQVIPIL